MKILAVGAHPDDIEFTCGGTLALLAEAGHEIAMMTVNNGSCGTAVHSREEIIAIRAEEARAAAAIIGASYHCAGIDDMRAVFDNDCRNRVTELFRKVAPEMVICPPVSDYMTDHEMAGQLTRDAAFTASLPNFKTGDPESAEPTSGHVHLYYVDPIEGKDPFGERVPFSTAVNVETVMNIKKKMLACHASQRDWLRRQHGIDQYLLTMEQWTRDAGKRASLPCAELFRQHLGHPYPTDNLLTSLLGESLTRP